LHFVKDLNLVILKDHTLKFAGKCKNCLIMRYLGAYFILKGKIFQEAILDFIIEWLRINATDKLKAFRAEAKVALALYKLI
jgi:hypothetical protein